MVKLKCKPVSKQMFSLLVLGATSLGNKRILQLADGRHECRAVVINLIGSCDEFFNFRLKDNGVGVFNSNPNGEYVLDITSDLTLKSTVEECSYFMEVICNRYSKKIKVGLRNGTRETTM